MDEDYHFELTAGGKNDPARVKWNEPLGCSLRFGDLQSYQVEYLPALRNVTQSLRQAHESPLGRLLRISEIDEEEKDSLVQILKDANEQIEEQPTINETGKEIRDSFSEASGEAFKMGPKAWNGRPFIRIDITFAESTTF